MAAMMPMMCQMQMPMAAMMPMMGMPMAAMMQAATGPPVPEEPPLITTKEEVDALEQEFKEAEQLAKDKAKKDGAYVGLMARYIEDEGFGFISCAECRETWDKTDIFVSGRNFVASGIDVGDMVVFQVEQDGKDLPRAANPKTLDDLTKTRRNLTRYKDALKACLKRDALANLQT